MRIYTNKGHAILGNKEGGEVKSEPLSAQLSYVPTNSSYVSEYDNRDRAFPRCMFQRNASRIVLTEHFGGLMWL